ncbi:MAG: malate dehydrogenase [Pseudomonadota bacterium]|nr:malate dehydrogenase [Pseudomonadota bacterium]
MSSISLAVTGAAGNIAYALLPRLGELLQDTETTLSLRLLEVESRMHALEGVVMELEDCAFPFIDEIIYTSNAEEAFFDVDYALLIGAMPRVQGMQRSDLLKANAGVFKEQGTALNKVADRNCQVLVVGNPCNTNAYLTMRFAPDLAKKNFFAMSMLDQNRAYAQLASILDISINQIDNLCVWGNHSDTMFADYFNALLDGQPLIEQFRKKEVLLREKYLPTVASRGSEVIKMRGSSSAASAANAALDSMIMLIDKNPDYGMFSIAICSSGEYGAKPGSIVSYPCQFDASGSLSVVSGLTHNDFAQGKLDASFAEIAQEIAQVESLLTTL